MNIKEFYSKWELKIMSFLCWFIDLAEWTFGLFRSKCPEKVTAQSNEEDFDFTFNFDTNNHAQ